VIDLRAGLKRYLFEGEVLRLMGFTALVKPIGLATQMVIASSFGAGLEYDAYVLAVFLVTFFDTAIGQVFNSVAVPFFIKLRTRMDRREFFSFQNTIYLFCLIPVAIFMTVLFFRGDFVVGMVGPRLIEESRVYAAKILRVLALPGLIMVAISLARSTLNLNRRFRIPATMPILNSVVMLGAIFVWRDQLGIWSLVVGFSVSAVLQVVIMGVYASRRGLVGAERPTAPEGTLSQFWSLSWMILVAQILLTVNAYVDRLFATGLEVGSVASLTYAKIIQNFGVQLFRASLVVVMFTKMSELLADENMTACNRYIEDNLRRMTRIVIPASLGLSLCSVELVRVLFQRGAFDSSDTERTAAALAMYLLGVPALIVNGVVTRTFHSLQKMRDRMWLAAQFLLTTVIGNLILVRHLGLVGLALSAVVAINLHVVLSFWFLYRYRIGLQVGRFVSIVVQAYLIGMLAAAVYWFSGLRGWLDGLFGDPTVLSDMITAAIRFSVVIAVCVAGYAALWLLKRRGSAAG